jgi:hypothetical protein
VPAASILVVALVSGCLGGPPRLVTYTDSGENLDVTDGSSEPDGALADGGSEMGSPDAATTDAGTADGGNDAGSASTGCVFTSDCLSNEACVAGVCEPATTCTRTLGACPSGTVSSIVAFQQCAACPTGSSASEVSDDPDAGFSCDGGAGYECYFTPCLATCTNPITDCPSGYQCAQPSTTTPVCYPITFGDEPSDAVLSCLGAEVAPGACQYNSDCAFNQVCDGGQCTPLPSCSSEITHCPDGTAEQPAGITQCEPCPSGTGEFAMANDADAGYSCPGGEVYSCEFSRCFLSCSENDPDCPAGLTCVPGSGAALFCEPFYSGTNPSQTALTCAGE